MNWFIIYILSSGILLTIAVNFVVTNMLNNYEKFPSSCEALDEELKPLGLKAKDLKHILPKLNLICLVFGWILIPWGLIQEVIGKLK